jgi:hypothetical protein
MVGCAFDVESNLSQVPETSSNAAQIEYWNGAAGEAWAQFQESLDRQVEPLGLAAMAVLEPREAEHILDIGCGCGQTTLASLPEYDQQAWSWVSISQSLCLMWPSADRARLRTCRSPFESWTHKLAISDMAVSMLPSLALASCSSAILWLRLPISVDR